MNFRVVCIQFVIDVLDRFRFYPKLRAFYSKTFSSRGENRVRTIVDVGSNRGQSIEFYLKLNKEVQIYGFEPNVTLFNKLREKYRANPGIVLNNVGVSSRNGKLLFYENIMDETSTFEEVNYNSDYFIRKARVLGVPAGNLIKDTYEVETITLASFLEANPGLFVDILKIDVEGHEYDCLLGLFDRPVTTCPIRFIQLERHNNDMYGGKGGRPGIEEILKSNGFEEVISIKHGFGDFHEIVYRNCRHPES